MYINDVLIIFEKMCQNKAYIYKRIIFYAYVL